MTFLVYHVQEDTAPSLEGIVEIKDFDDFNKKNISRRYCNNTYNKFRWVTIISLYSSGYKSLIDELASTGVVETNFDMVQEKGEYNYILIKD